MDITNAIIDYRRHLKRCNCSAQTIKGYMNKLKQFVLWIDVPLEQVTRDNLVDYVDHLISKKSKPKTINCHISCVRAFYEYLEREDALKVANPVRKGYCLRLPQPLPRFLNDDEVIKLFEVIKTRRDRAVFMLMLRTGLRVEEVSRLTVGAVDLKGNKIFVHQGKGGRDRVVYISSDAHQTLVEYLSHRPPTRSKGLFLVEKGICRGSPISVRGIQKRIEYYSGKAGLKVSCHQLRHTMATQLLNADTGLSTIQDLLGHQLIATTQRYCRVCNLKVQRDYHRAMEVVMQRTLPMRQ